MLTMVLLARKNRRACPPGFSLMPASHRRQGRRAPFVLRPGWHGVESADAAVARGVGVSSERTARMSRSWETISVSTVPTAGSRRVISQRTSLATGETAVLRDRPESRHRVPTKHPFRLGVPAALALVLVASALFAIRLDLPAFYDNEGRYAEVAREMAASGDFVTPQLDGTLFLNKPPLVYWLSAVVFRIAGP